MNNKCKNCGVLLMELPSDTHMTSWGTKPDESHKEIVEKKCDCCGRKIRVFTQNLKQSKYCPDCQKGKRAAKGNGHEEAEQTSLEILTAGSGDSKKSASIASNKDFWNELEEKYKKRPGKEYWEKEKRAVQEIIAAIEDQIRDRYRIIWPLGTGGTAIVLEIHDENLNISQALKLGRPVIGRELLLSQIIAKEISRLRETNHPNVIQIFMHGSVKWNSQNWPYYIMEFVPGGKDAGELIESGIDSRGNSISGDTVISWIRQIAEGLAYLHTKGTLHGDVKLENVLVSPDGRVRITDLGSARLLSLDEQDTILTFTRPWAHPELRGMMATPSTADSNRVKVSIERSRLRPAFDMFALGKNIFRLLTNKHFDPADNVLMKPYERAYLELVASRLLDGHIEDSERALGLPRKVLDEIKYQSVTELLLDMKKLTGEYAPHTIIPELDHHFPRTIQVISPAPSPYSEGLAGILEEPLIRRLGNVSQLGLIVQIYPTATHSRLEHVLGTFAHVARYIDSLWNDPINPLFKQIMTLRDIKTLIVAALCHDIGQYPLAHDLAEAEPEMFGHQTIGNSILRGEIKRPDVVSLRKKIEDIWDVDPSEVADILSCDPAVLTYPIKKRILHTILDGPIDADKIDYLIRDSTSLGVPYGKAIDIERFLRCLTVTFRPEAEETFASIGIHEKGKVTAEAFAFARYALFGTVYWHHTSRAMKAMLHMAVWQAIPQTGRRSKEYGDMRRDLERLLFENQIIPSQLSLLRESQEDRLKETTYLHPWDLAMLEWIYARSSDQGKKLIKMLCARKLFKRLIVISGLKSLTLWKKMTSISRDFSIPEKVRFQKEVQRALVSLINKIDNSKRTTSALYPEATDNLVARASCGEILFLIDIPSERKASNIDLYFLPEKRVGDSTMLQSEKAQMEDSIIWSRISESFQESVGKVRVFVHPDFVKTATAALSRSDIESTLESVYRTIVSERT
jgi:HD superfamily phosphohydrolase